MITFSPSGPTIRQILLALFGALLALYFYVPPSSVADVTLDGSNFASYARFTGIGAQFGEEVLAPVGPYGFVMYGKVYSGDLFWLRAGLEGLLKICAAGLALWFMGQLPRWWMRVMWLSAYVLIVPTLPGASYDVSVLLGGLLLLSLSGQSTGSRVAISSVASLLAFVALIKGTHLSLSMVTLVLVGGTALRERNGKKAGLVTLAFGVSLLVWWVLAGQNPIHLPRFIRAILELSSGYNAAMGLQEPEEAFTTGASAFLALSALWTGLALVSLRQSAVLGASIMLAAFTFVSWKHGFVRADGHIFIFYRYAIFLAVTGIVLIWGKTSTELPRGGRWWQIGLTTVALLAAWVGAIGDGHTPLARWQWEVSRIPQIAKSSWQFLSSPVARQKELEEQLNENRQRYDLPRTRSRVESDPIDFFGPDHGYLTLNGLNYRPRPMGGGSFCAFTPWLQAANADFVSNDTHAPNYYLARLAPIDSRFAAQEDAQALRQLLKTYRPVDLEQGMLLFERNRPSPPTLEPILLNRTRGAQLGEWIDVPQVADDEMLLVAFDLPLNLQGKLRKFFYKPPTLYLFVQGSGITNESFLRIVPGMVSEPTILQPFLERTVDLLNVYGTSATKQVDRIRLDSPQPELWDDRGVHLTFYTLPRPKMDAAGQSRLRAMSTYPVSSRLPRESVDPQRIARTPDGLPLHILHAPGTVSFDLNGDERSFSLGYGIEDRAWEEGETDGVTLSVELVHPSGAVFPYFQRHLDPKAEPADRGYQHSEIVLPPAIPAGSFLRVRSDTGPTGNGAWDWFYVTNLNFVSGPFTPNQFPGFATLPVAVHAEHCGPLPYDGRQVVMLNAPGALDFEVPPSAGSLRFKAGLIAGAYLEGESDGADYVIESLDTTGTAREIWRRELRPLTDLDDRGDIVCEVPIPAGSDGTRIRLRTDPGPSGNASWDWTYLADLHFE